jgi:hypothetical protein
MKAVIVTYIVKKGKEKEFEKVLRKHWRQLCKDKLTTAQAPFLLRDPENPTVYKEVFEWKVASSMSKAYRYPDVRKIWDHMRELTEEGGIEHGHFKRI